MPFRRERLQEKFQDFVAVPDFGFLQFLTADAFVMCERWVADPEYFLVVLDSREQE